MLHYAVQPFSVIATDYSFPNNHILHGMVVATSHLWMVWPVGFGTAFAGAYGGTPGDDPDDVAGLGSQSGQTRVLLAAIFGSSSYPLVYYSVNGRGYSMQMMFTLVIGIVLVRAKTYRSPILPIILLSLRFVLPLVHGSFRHRCGITAVSWGAALGCASSFKNTSTLYAPDFYDCGLMLLSAWGPMLHSITAVSAASAQRRRGLFYLQPLGWRPMGYSLFFFAGRLYWPAFGSWRKKCRCGLHCCRGSIRVRHFPDRRRILVSFACPMFDRSYSPLFPLAYVVMAFGIVKGMKLVPNKISLSFHL